MYIWFVSEQLVPGSGREVRRTSVMREILRNMCTEQGVLRPYEHFDTNDVTKRNLEDIIRQCTGVYTLIRESPRWFVLTQPWGFIADTNQVGLLCWL